VHSRGLSAREHLETPLRSHQRLQPGTLDADSLRDRHAARAPGAARRRVGHPDHAVDSRRRPVARRAPALRRSLAEPLNSHLEKLEAPPGFEPGMEVLQIQRVVNRVVSCWSLVCPAPSFCLVSGPYWTTFGLRLPVIALPPSGLLTITCRRGLNPRSLARGHLSVLAFLLKMTRPRVSSPAAGTRACLMSNVFTTAIAAAGTHVSLQMPLRAGRMIMLLPRWLR
jgi:hypothetical protein